MTFIQLRDYLHNCINGGRYYQLIDLKRVMVVDEIGANVFTHFNYSRLYITIFNVKPEILNDLIIPKEAVNIKIFEEKDASKVASYVELEILNSLTNPSSREDFKSAKEIWY